MQLAERFARAHDSLAQRAERAGECLEGFAAGNGCREAVLSGTSVSRGIELQVLTAHHMALAALRSLVKNYPKSFNGYVDVSDSRFYNENSIVYSNSIFFVLTVDGQEASCSVHNLSL